MTYKSLYRKYRPNSFEDVCGQEFIVKTLKNTISSNKIGHAYLFCGTRGTGKTTIAKIFAKAVNCLDNKERPCGKCEICKCENTDEIQDVIEIDAASNNGVDEIRELKNKIKLMPVFCKYKVYIIDEVHMLSTGAFNALLKTLEEPPEHVIFILATTEPQKLPITIISRCQRFDFKKISLINIENRLKFISKEEKIDITQESIEEIAKMSGGALRDAIGLLDQVSSFKDATITIDDIYMISGNVSYKTIYEFVDSYIDGNVEVMLKIIEDIYISGKDFTKLTEKLLMIFRNILIMKRAPKYFKLNETADSEYIKTIASKIEDKTLENIIKNIDALLKEIKSSDYPRVLFELFALKTMTNEIDETVIKEKATESKKVLKEDIIKNQINTDNETTKQIEKKEESKQETKNNEVINKVEISIVENTYTKATKLEFNAKNDEYKKPLINNTIALATAKCKKSIEESLEELDKYLVNKKHKTAATILKDASVRAASTDHILLTYKYESMVEDTDKDIEKIINLIKEITATDYKIVAITEEEWKEMRPYYLELKKKNGKIDLLDEISNVISEDKEQKNDTLFDEVIDAFGSELIEMEG